MDSLFDLVDDHTEYFKSHLESLPAQERRVYLALADLWKPALTKEVAERARLNTSKCSTQLARLIERGVVRLEGGSVRRKQYYLSERMYNIYYLLRRGQERLVEVLVRFMEAYYSPEELKDISARIGPRREKCCAGGSIAVSVRLRTASGNVRLKRINAQRRVRWQTLEYPLSEPQTSAFLVGLAIAHVTKSAIPGQSSEWDDALAACDEVLRRFGDSDALKVVEQVAVALVIKATVLGELDRREEALAACDEVLRRFRRWQNTPACGAGGKGPRHKGCGTQRVEPDGRSAGRLR